LQNAWLPFSYFFHLPRTFLFFFFRGVAGGVAGGVALLSPVD